MPRMLQARSIGEILDDVFRQYRHYFGQLFVISLVFLAPIIILDTLFTSQIPAVQYQSLVTGHTSQFLAQFSHSGATTLAQPALIGSLVVSLLSILVSTPLTEGSYYLLTIDTLVYDRKLPSPWGYVQRISRRWGAYLATLLLIVSLSAVVFAVLAGAVFLAAKSGSLVTGLILLYVLLLFAFIWLGIRLEFVFVSVFLERKRNWGALARSFFLTSGSFWRLFMILLVADLILGFASSGLAAIFNLVLPLNALRVLGSGLISILLAPLMSLLIANLYMDLRIRREGYDLELRAGGE